MKIGDVVKARGVPNGYKDKYVVIETFTNDKHNGDDGVIISWQEPHSNVIRTQFVAVSCLEVVEKEDQ